MILTNDSNRLNLELTGRKGMKYISFLLITFFTWSLFAAQRNLMAVGQGISSPSITSNLIISNGFTSENPTGIAYQNAFRFTGEFDTGDNNSTNDGMGVEVGIGNGEIGMALGFYQIDDCDTCDEQVYGGFGILLGDFIGFGASGQEELYNAGVIFNPKGSFRFGIMASHFNLEGDDNNFTSFGAGFSYFANSWNFTLDASKRDFENDSDSGDIIKITPGLKMNVDFIHFSVNIDNYINEPEGTAEIDDDLWFGIGFGHGEPFNLNIYHDFYNEWAIVGSLFL